MAQIGILKTLYWDNGSLQTKLNQKTFPFCLCPIHVGYVTSPVNSALNHYIQGANDIQQMQLISPSYIEFSLIQYIVQVYCKTKISANNNII